MLYLEYSITNHCLISLKHWGGFHFDYILIVSLYPHWCGFNAFLKKFTFLNPITTKHFKTLCPFFKLITEMILVEIWNPIKGLFDFIQGRKI